MDTYFQILCVYGLKTNKRNERRTDQYYSVISLVDLKQLTVSALPFPGGVTMLNYCSWKVDF